MDDTKKLKQIFKYGSKAFFDANPYPQLQDPKSQYSLSKSLDVPTTGPEKSNGRAHLRITAYTVRPRDPDNLAGGCKSLIDCCTQLGLIRGDDPSSITLEVGQKKVDHFSQEKTLLEITYDLDN